MKYRKLIWIIIFIVGVTVRSTDLLHPIDTESWREADVSTMAKNYYINGTNIFHPQIAWDGSGPGYTESEFQFYSFLISLTYKFFGIWEPAGRVISFLFSIFTMLIFFRLSRYLLDTESAIVASCFFILSPILFVIANSIQPESVMFFFYVGSGYTFIRWLDKQSNKYFILTILFTALAILCKLTAANIGLFFIFLIVTKKGWKYLYNPRILLFGFLSVLPSIIWYLYCHQFYVLYGNSLGLSNEYAWVGWDFFTNGHFLFGIVKVELFNVWTLSGPLIIILALLFSKLIKKESTLLAIYWFTSAVIFYLITARTTADDWAYYYHIFSIPAVSILLGSSVIELYNNNLPMLDFRKAIDVSWFKSLKSTVIFIFLIVFVSYFFLSSFTFLFKIKDTVFQTSGFYSCSNTLKGLIPQKSFILVNGGLSKDKLGYPHAYNSSYFYYWLDRKGYNISIEDLSVEKILYFKLNGVAFFLAEDRVVDLKFGLKEELKKNFDIILECNGCVLYRL